MLYILPLFPDICKFFLLQESDAFFINHFNSCNCFYFHFFIMIMAFFVKYHFNILAIDSKFILGFLVFFILGKNLNIIQN